LALSSRRRERVGPVGGGIFGIYNTV